ncbi:RecQ-mediated genome instability protein [Dirofilaria immitis]
MLQYIAIFLSASLIVPTAQICCPSSSAISPDNRSINISIPVPYNFTFSGFGDLLRVAFQVLHISSTSLDISDQRA